MTGTTSNKSNRMWGMSLDTWNNVLLVFLAVAALAAAVVGFSTYATIQLAKEEAAASKEEFEKYKLTVEGKVADAKAEGIEAGKTAGNAVVRAAELEKEAAEARLQTEKIKQAVAWRVIPPETAVQLKKAIEINPGKLNLRYTSGDPEALFLAIQFSKIFSEAKWQIAPGAEVSDSLIFGISLPDPANDEMRALRAGFAAAGIPFSTQEISIQRSHVQFNVSTIPGAPTLIIGSRPPPILQ